MSHSLYKCIVSSEHMRGGGAAYILLPSKHTPWVDGYTFLWEDILQVVVFFSVGPRHVEPHNHVPEVFNIPPLERLGKVIHHHIISPAVVNYNLCAVPPILYEEVPESWVSSFVCWTHNH